MELNAFFETLISAALGAGLTLFAVYKFGEKILFKHLDHKYSEKLEARKSELQIELEETKKHLNTALQLSVANHKANLDVLAGQRARYLERKIDCILEINKRHVVASRQLAIFTEWAHDQTSTALMMYGENSEHQSRALASGATYTHRMQLIDKKIPPANSALSAYKEYLILNLPILPIEFSEKEIARFNEMMSALDAAHYASRRSTGLISELASSEENMSYEDIQAEFIQKKKETYDSNCIATRINERLLEKATESRIIVDTMLKGDA
jgi:hypothetical protein